MPDQTPPPMPDHQPTPPKRKTNAIIIGSAVAVIAAIIGTGVIITTSSSDNSEAAPTVTVTVTAAAEATESEPSSPGEEAGFKVGEEARNRGTIVKITKVREGNTITLAGAAKNAGADAKYVTLETIVTNETKASMDLTCSLPIVNALIDDQERRYDTIDDLYEVPGNPECNAQLQPGFKDDMRFVYRVPKDAKITAWEFEEYDLETEPAPSLIDLT